MIQAKTVITIHRPLLEDALCSQSFDESLWKSVHLPKSPSSCHGMEGRHRWHYMKEKSNFQQIPYFYHNGICLRMLMVDHDYKSKYLVLNLKM